MTATSTRTERTVTVMLPGSQAVWAVTLRPYGEVSSEVLVQGEVIGTVAEHREDAASASPAGTPKFYRFASSEAAVAACLSYWLRGYWTDEV